MKKVLLAIFLLNNLDLVLTMCAVHGLNVAYEANPLMYDFIHNRPIIACVIKNAITILLMIGIAVIWTKRPKHITTKMLTCFAVIAPLIACIWNMAIIACAYSRGFI